MNSVGSMRRQTFCFSMPRANPFTTYNGAEVFLKLHLDFHFPVILRHFVQFKVFENLSNSVGNIS